MSGRGGGIRTHDHQSPSLARTVPGCTLTFGLCGGAFYFVAPRPRSFAPIATTKLTAKGAIRPCPNDEERRRSAEEERRRAEAEERRSREERDRELREAQKSIHGGEDPRRREGGADDE